MLYVYYGNDHVSVREKAHEQTLRLKGVCGEIIHITNEVYTEGMLADLLQSESLFGGIKLVSIDLSDDEAELCDACIDSLEAFADSVHHFILIGNAFGAAQKKKINTIAQEAHEYTQEKESFNTFALTDALLMRDKKKLWILLNEAWLHGVSAEELVGLLFWQMKVLRLVQKTKTPEEAELKPFVYQKAKRALSVYTQNEIDSLSEKLIQMYHNAHLGKVDMNQSLERWVLQL